MHICDVMPCYNMVGSHHMLNFDHFFPSVFLSLTVNNRWTGLDSSGLVNIVSNTDTNSIGLGWKRSFKNKCHFVALSLQLVREEWNTNCTLVVT